MYWLTQQHWHLQFCKEEVITSELGDVAEISDQSAEGVAYFSLVLGVKGK